MFEMAESIRLAFAYQKLATNILVSALLWMGIGSLVLANVTEGSFEKLYQGYLDDPLPDEITQKVASRYTYVFVPGFLNEIAPLYFTDHISFLHKTGVAKGHITVLQPLSKRAMLGNAELIHDAVKHRFLQFKRPVVLISHSKGAAETLTALVRYPQLSRMVERVYLLQGAFRGSPVADMLKYSSGSLTLLSWTARVQVFTAQKFLRMFGYFSSPGFNDLTAKGGAILFSSFYTTSPQLKEEIARKVHFITSYVDKCKVLARVIRPFGCWFESIGDKSDGLLALKDQSIPDFGMRTVLKDRDHVDLVISQPISWRKIRVRQALIKSMIYALR